MNASRSIIYPLVAMAFVVTGCGGSSKPSTTTVQTTASSGTGATGTATTPTGPQSTSSKTGPPAKSGSSTATGTTTGAQTQPQQKPSKQKAQTTKPAGPPPPPATAVPSVPPKKRFALSIQEKFVGLCQEAGPRPLCECILARQELLPGEKGQGIAEMLVVEAAIRKGITVQEQAQHRVRLPERITRTLARCSHA